MGKLDRDRIRGENKDLKAKQGQNTNKSIIIYNKKHFSFLKSFKK